MQDAKGDAKYNGAAVDDFLTALEEATRAVPEGGPTVFVPPAGGELEQVKARFHHFIFGRRGSGKTSLMRFLEHQNQKDGRSAVWIDQELFMQLSYPDVLVSSVLEVMRGLSEDVDRKEKNNLSRWNRLLKKLRIKNSSSETLRALVRTVENLETLKHLPDDRQIEWTRTSSTGSSVDAVGSVRAGPLNVGVQAGSTASEDVKMTETVLSSKEEFLERTLDENRKLIRASVESETGGFVFLDEFNRVEREDQPRVLGYMHRLLKDTGLWLKIATVRYRTKPYKGGSSPQGMQLTHDANEVSLDRGLRLFGSTREFLEEILTSIGARNEVDVRDLMTDGALTRLVVAAGGVPRDYLRLARESVKHARNRGPSDKQGSDKVIAEDVNSAAGQTAEAKFSDLREDAPNAVADLERLLDDLGEFCRRNKAAYFMVDGKDPDLTAQIDQLQDLRFVHLLNDNETVPNAGSGRHRVLLLDVAYLSHKRARNVDFDGWIDDRSKRRRPKLIYTGGAGGPITLPGLNTP